MFGRVTLTIRKLEQEILASGHNVCILTTLSGDPKNTDLDGSHPNRRVIFMDNAKPIPFVHDPNKPELTYQLGFSLSTSVQQEIAAFEPSIIHITCPDCTALHLIQYARTHEIPLMGTYHSNIPEYMEHYPGLSWLKHILGAFFRHQYNFLQALYVPTPYIQNHLIQNYKMDRATSLEVWGRGVDIDKFNPSHRSLKFRRDLGIDDQDVVVCWVGRLVPEKRVDIFCDTVRRLKERNARFHALVVGAGPCEEEINTLPNTTFCGWMNADQLSVAYASSDVFLFPSSVETFGNVTLEAMASGLPVVVEEGCSGHLVRDGESGFACPADDADAFFEATLALVSDKSMRIDFSEQSRRLSQAMEKRAVVRKMMDNYSRVTDEFFTEYGGHHANRDAAYRQPDSFTAGNHPRPLLLVAVEWLFIVLFQVIWNMTEMFLYMQESMGAVRLRSPVTLETNNVALTGSPASTPSRLKRASSELESKFVEVDIEDPLQMDDDTASTVSESEESDPRSSSSSLCSCGHPTFSEFKISHVLAKSFIQAMQFQCRMESHFRNTCSSCCSRSLLGSAKRKNSSYEIDEIKVRPADQYDLIDDASRGLTDGRRMRRNQPVIDV